MVFVWGLGKGTFDQKTGWVLQLGTSKCFSFFLYPRLVFLGDAGVLYSV